MKTQGATSSRGEMLKQLRELHADSVARTQALYKEQRNITNAICKAIGEQSKTVPEVAEITGLATNIVLWYLTALKKYGVITECGMCGDYPLYRKAEEV